MQPRRSVWNDARSSERPVWPAFLPRALPRRSCMRKPTSAGASPDRNRTFRPDIEGLRAIAVMLVLLDHAGLSLVSGGYVGVDVFFVLSGFLITGLLLKEAQETGGISIGRFYARRAQG